MSSILKPLSSITAMSLSRRGIMPDCLNSSLSLTEPEYRDDTNVTVLCGDTPIKPFRVVCDLYCKKSSPCNTKDDGAWHLNSVQSIMTCVSLYFPNTLGIIALTVSGDIHMTTAPSTVYRKFAHVFKILLTVDWCMLKQSPRSFSFRPRDRYTRNRKSSSINGRHQLWWRRQMDKLYWQKKPNFIYKAHA